MKIFNLPRGSGKTMRMLYASEFNNAPILCKNLSDKEYKLELAKRYGIKIPEPICVSELFCRPRSEKARNINEVLVDEAIVILQEILSNNQRCTKIIGCTLSDENNGALCATSDEDGKFSTVRIDDLFR